MSKFGEVRLRDDTGANHADPNADGQLPVLADLNSVVDGDNSTTSVLGISGVFTGLSTEILGYSSIMVNVYSDVASTTDGLSIEQSSDGANWDQTDEFTIPASTGKNFTINPHARYLRVVYTNGAVAQTAFRLQTILKAGEATPSSHKIQDGISTDDDARLTKSVLTGENGSGSFKNVKVTADGNLAIVDNSSGLSIAQGKVTGLSTVHKFGDAPDFDSTDGTVTIWDGADDAGANAMAYTYSSTADIDQIVSDNASDTEDIEIQGLDSNYNLVTQTATLTGLTPVTLGTALIRVFRMKNIGSSDLIGQVTCYINGGSSSTAADIRAIIDNGNNQTLMALYTIPAGYNAYVRSWFAGTAGANKSASYQIDLYVRPFGQVFQLKHRSSIQDGGSTSEQHPYIDPPAYPEKSDIEIRATILDSPITAASISGGFDLVLEEI